MSIFSKRGRYAERTLWISVGHLKIGMFVCALDRSWLETPFPLEGVMIRSLRDIEILKLYCDKVEIDVYKCWLDIDPEVYGAAKGRNRKPRKIIERIRKLGEGLTDIASENQEEQPLEAEIATAKKIYSESVSTLNEIIENIRLGKEFDYAPVKTMALEMVGSILRNSDALVWLSQLRNKDDYAYQHSINVCILMLSLGKHLALSPDQLANLGVAGLLQDVGVLKLPAELLHKQGKLTPQELTLAKSHVTKSLELLQHQPGISRSVLDTIHEHHERHDGSGYPNGLKASQISLFGSIAGICDCYDAMLSERPYAGAKSSFQSLMVLYELKGSAFNPAVVERFIQCIGIYPIGSVVELKTGEVGIVVEQRKHRRLKPKLLIILDRDKQRFETPFDLDLLQDPTESEGVPYSIRDVLSSGAYGIDPAEYFLV